MLALSLSGRVVVATDLRPLHNVTVRLEGPASILSRVPGSQTITIPRSFTWSRQLTGFGGSRWDCWTQEVQNKVPGITWEQFRDGVLLRNPQLNADGRLFRPYKAYLVPEPNIVPQAYLETRTDAAGAYSFARPEQPTTYELQVQLEGYAHFAQPLVVNASVTQPIMLVPQTNAGTLPSSGVRSARVDYGTLPSKVRRLIDQALSMLGDDGQVFDALPPDLRKLCFGSRFLANPNHPRYKDFACADVVSIALTAAGCDLRWGSQANPHMADFYHPDRGNSRLIEIHSQSDWQPGDVLVYGSGAPSSRARHVNLYVGPFSGIDRSGKRYGLSDGVDVVEGSLDFWSNGRQLGTGIIGCNLQRCLQAKRGAYTWVRHVRLRELAGHP